MATKLKKRDFDKYNVNGFKIGDVICIPGTNVHQAEIIAIDSCENVEYSIMIDATEANLKECDFIDVPIKDCNSETVYYRKKALNSRYEIWVDVTIVQHIAEDSDNKQEENGIGDAEI